MEERQIQPLSDILDRIELTKKDRKDLEYYIQEGKSFETLSDNEIDLITNEVFGISSAYGSGSGISIIGEV